MTDRERLKNKIDYLQKVFMEDNDYDYFNEFLADRLLEDKDVIVPPCKVGDDIYWIDSDTNEIKCQKNGIKAVCYFGDDNFKIISKDENTPEDIGTRWCMFTKEEAEKALERSKG